MTSCNQPALLPAIIFDIKNHVIRNPDVFWWYFLPFLKHTKSLKFVDGSKFSINGPTPEVILDERINGKGFSSISWDLHAKFILGGMRTLGSQCSCCVDYEVRVFNVRVCPLEVGVCEKVLFSCILRKDPWILGLKCVSTDPTDLSIAPKDFGA